MNEFEAVGKLLDYLGVKPIIGPLLAIIALLFLIKKYLFNGFSSFLKDSIKEWLADQREKTKAEVSIWEKLKDIDEKFASMQDAMWDNRRYMETQYRTSEELTRQHIAETHNLILLLKKKTDQVNESNPLIDTQYFKATQPQGDPS